MKKQFAFFATLVLATTVFIVAARTAPEELPPTIHFLFPAEQLLAGQSTESLMKRLAEIVSKKVGRPFVVDKTNLQAGKNRLDMVLGKFKSKEADLSYLPSMIYAENRAKIDAVARPIATITIENKTHSDVCLYVRKSDNITKVSELKGKKWGGNILYQSRLALHDNGFDMPVDKFFSELHYYSDADYKVWVQALLSGKIDTFAHLPSTMRIVMSSSEGGMKIAPIGCVENDHNWIFFVRRGISDDFVQKLATTLFDAHKDKDFKEFGFVFTMLKGHFAPFQESNLTRTIQIKDMVKKGHWRDEEAAFNKKYAPPGTKLYYE
jgi:ABC-type phosphate/phosphonate transport system substrate-binding protein